MTWPTFKLKRNGKRVGLNPALVSALHEKSDDITEVYTLDCSKDEDAWDVAAPFDEVLVKLSGKKELGPLPPTPEPSDGEPLRKGFVDKEN